MGLSREHLIELAEARSLLENPGLTAKVGNLLGRPIEKGFELLPAGWRDRIAHATHEALLTALKGALLTLQPEAQPPRPLWHKIAATVSGAAGGAFGLPALIVELPVSTAIICRSIADIARANGESLDAPATQLACLEVFALGGSSGADDAGETGYFAVRSALARAVSEAGDYLLKHAVLQDGAPALVRLVALVASRFNVQVSEKAAAQAVPLIGAAGGAMINLLFIDHFQNVSRGHFTVRRLERLYGAGVVRRAYRGESGEGSGGE